MDLWCFWITIQAPGRQSFFAAPPMARGKPSRIKPSPQHTGQGWCMQAGWQGPNSWPESDWRGGCMHKRSNRGVCNCKPHLGSRHVVFSPHTCKWDPKVRTLAGSVACNHLQAHACIGPFMSEGTLQGEWGGWQVGRVTTFA